MHRTMPFSVGVMLLVGSAGAALAAQRTFVASHGLDTNPCSITAPCRSFATALLVTADAGEIVVLDSAGYGAVSIAQNVSIISPSGVYGGLSVFAGAGIVVNGAGINVTLRGLSINGQGGVTGIDFQAGARLRVEGVEISNFSGNGINITAPNSEVLVVDSIVHDLAGNGIDAAATTNVTVDRVRFDRTNNGVYARDGSSVGISNSVIANSAVSGVNVQAAAPFVAIRVQIDACTLTGATNEVVYVNTQGANSSVDLAVTRSMIAGNGNGIGLTAPASGSTVTATVKDNTISKNFGNGVYAQFAGATAVLSGNSLVGNQTGLRILSGGVLKSNGANVMNNGVDLTGGVMTPATLL